MLRRSPSFYKGPWVTLWVYEVDVNLPQSPVEDVGFPPEGFPNYHASGEQDSELDQDVATPTSGTAWNSDEELTPLFSSNFPRIPHPDAFGAKVTLMESSWESAPQVPPALTHYSE